MVNFKSADQATHTLEILFNSKKLSDVTLIARKDGFRLDAHKAVLVVSSTFFESIFCGKNPSSKKEVVIESISGQILCSVIKFLYTGVIDINDKNAIEIWKAAEYLKIATITSHAIKFLLDTLNVQNAIDLIILAKSFTQTLMYNAIKKFMTANYSAFVKNKDLFKVEEVAHAIQDLFEQSLIRKNLDKKNRSQRDETKLISLFVPSADSRKIGETKLISLFSPNDETGKIAKENQQNKIRESVTKSSARLESQSICELATITFVGNPKDILLVVTEINDHTKSVIQYHALQKFSNHQFMDINGSIIGIWNDHFVTLSELQLRLHNFKTGKKARTFKTELISDFVDHTVLEDCLYLLYTDSYFKINLKTGLNEEVLAPVSFKFIAMAQRNGNVYFVTKNPKNNIQVIRRSARKGNWELFRPLSHSINQGSAVATKKSIHIFGAGISTYNFDTDDWVQVPKNQQNNFISAAVVNNKVFCATNFQLFEYFPDKFQIGVNLNLHHGKTQLFPLL